MRLYVVNCINCVVVDLVVGALCRGTLEGQLWQRPIILRAAVVELFALECSNGNVERWL